MATVAVSSGYTLEVDGVSEADWAGVINTFDDSTIYQTWPWGEIRWGRENLSHAVLKKGPAIIAAAQCWIIKVLGCGIAYFKCGPMSRKGAERLNADQFRMFVRAIRTHYSEERGLLVRVMGNGFCADHAEAAAILADEGFSRCTTSPSYRTIIMDLAHPEADLRKAMKRQWANSLKQCEKLPFDIVQDSEGKLFDEFRNLYAETISRKNFKEELNLDDLQRINESLPEWSKVRIIMCALGGEMLSGILVCPVGKTAVVLFSANSSKGIELQASRYVWWHGARLMKEAGVLWLDLGGIDPETCSGTYQFKKGFAGTLGRDVTFEHYDYCSNLSSKVVTQVSDHLRGSFKGTAQILRKFRESMT